MNLKRPIKKATTTLKRNANVITFEKENNSYTYEATSSLLDKDEDILKDLIHDIISKFQKGKLMISYAKIKFLNRIAPSGNNLENLTNTRSQGCPRFQSGEELANSVGKINA